VTLRGHIRRYLVEMTAIVCFMLIAGVVAAYILDEQRLRWPWEDVMQIEAEFTTGQAVSPGQGQSVTVSGVKVGEIGRVELEEGRAVLRLDLEQKRLGPIYRNLRMQLKPKTGLNDMSVQLDPGRPDRAQPEGGRLRDGDRVPIARTETNVNPDEVLSALDADTRRYLAAAVGSLGKGLSGRSDQLRAVLRAGQPTLSKSARVGRAIADRRRQLRRLIANLRRLADAAAEKDTELAGLVDSSAATFDTLGRREAELQASVERLPGALGAFRVALRDSRAFANEAAPAFVALRPAARQLGPALRDVRPLLRDSVPIVREDLRPLVREATPLLRDLRPALGDLNAVTPRLIRVGRVLNYVANELGHNPPGSEEGYLFWVAWFAHNANSIFSIDDAHGAVWRGLGQVGCTTAGNAVATVPILQALTQSAVCPP
jgi:phospholipid/cholesterol/gamma-HCH transport system substrate-binding protein